MTATASYSIEEVAALLDRSKDWFYRHRGKLQREQKFPGPIVPGGKMRFHKASVDAWIARHHPQAALLIPVAANDTPVIPADPTEWPAYLARAYGQPTEFQVTSEELKVLSAQRQQSGPPQPKI